jgi:hypothetical protein
MSDVITPERQTSTAAKTPGRRGHAVSPPEQSSWLGRNWKVLGGSVVALLAAGSSLVLLHNKDESDKQAALAEARKTDAANVIQATDAATTAGITRAFGLLGYNVTRPGNSEIKIVEVDGSYEAVATNPELAQQLTEKINHPLSEDPTQPPTLEVTQDFPIINGITGAVMGSSPARNVVVSTPAEYDALVASAVGADSHNSTPSK